MRALGTIALTLSRPRVARCSISHGGAADRPLHCEAVRLHRGRVLRGMRCPIADARARGYAAGVTDEGSTA